MKFYIPAIGLRETNDFHENVFEFLNPAEFSFRHRTITLDQWANGWIIESDDSFRSYFMIMTGRELPIITDEEYIQFITCKVLFLSKAKSIEFREIIASFKNKDK